MSLPFDRASQKIPRRQVVRAGTALLAAGAVAACSGNATSGGTNSSGAAPTTGAAKSGAAPATAPAVISGKPLEISYGQFEIFKTQWDMHVAIVNEFNKTHPKIHVTMKGPTHAKMLTEVAAHTAQDLVNTYSELTLGPKGALIDQSPYIKSAKNFQTEVLNPDALKYYAYEGKVYGSPTAIATEQCLYYNEDLFKKAGVKVPSDTVWTFNDYTEAAVKLQKSFGEGSSTFASTPLDNWDYAVYANGGKVWSDDGTKVLIGSQEARDAYKWSWDLSLKYKVTPSQAQVKSMGGTGRADASNQVVRTRSK